MKSDIHTDTAVLASKEDRDGKLIAVKVDYVFAKLFGKRSHERVLVCLLNAILNGKPHIKNVTLDPTEYKKTSPDGKSVRLDRPHRMMAPDYILKCSATMKETSETEHLFVKHVFVRMNLRKERVIALSQTLFPFGFVTSL